ncbi:hypothetical protein ABKN59_008302 [Abortiporus biennis]
MQLASHGAKAFAGRQVNNFTPLKASRSIHIPSFVPRPVKPTGSTVQTVLRQTRTLLSRFVDHLTAPGSFANVSTARSIATSPHIHRTSIKHGLSLPVKYALGRPLHSPHLPRAPAVPRSTTQVGLGTARNFSTGRPIFQSLADNVPVTGRAFWEADWELRLKEERAKLAPKKRNGKKENKDRGQMMQPKVSKIETTSTSEEESRKAELDHYFPAPITPDVTTYLLIPLAPTPTSRLPLSPSPHHPSAHPLLPLAVLSAVHTDHGTHTLRVQTLFSRLDTAHVFEDSNVTCSAHGDPSGLCTVLEVKFSGWEESKVRSILGEAGTGWCLLEEVRKDEQQAEQDEMEELMSSLTTPGSSTPPTVEIDPASSFVLPTLDFSASFSTSQPQWTPPQSVISNPLADLEFHNAWSSASSDSDRFSDTLSDLDSADWSDDFSAASLPSRRPSSGSEGWVGLSFSSQFSGRMLESTGNVPAWEYEMPEPREMMF